MRKIFTLFAALLCAVVANAEMYEWYIEGTTEVKPAQFQSASLSPNKAYTGTYITVNEKKIVCTKGAKMGGSTYVKFTSERSCTVIIVQSTSRSGEENRNIAFDGTQIPITEGVENPIGCETVRVYTKTSVPAGDHSVTRGDGQTGLMYVAYILDELVGEQLAAPGITFDKTTGEVTIAPVTNATKVVYTTDGSMPDENSTTYTEPFTVEDGTVVKAIAIGDGVNYSNSTVTEVEVLLAGLTCEAPEFAQFNGTFAITTATKLASCEYSFDGTTWVPYTIPVTLTETKTVKARTVRDGWTASDVVEAEVIALPAVESTKTILMGWGSFDNNGNVLNGKAGDPAEGFALAMPENPSKTWASNKKKIKMGSEERTDMYGSNGLEVEMTVPKHLVVTRITFYSYLPTGDRATSWSSVNGADNNSVDLVPMASHDCGNPDVRIFNIENGSGIVKFNNCGERPNFVMAVDVVDLTPAAPALTIDGANIESVELTGSNKTVVITPAAEGHNVYYLFKETPAEETQPENPETPETPAGVIARAEGEGAEGEGTEGDVTPEGPKANLDHNGETYTLVPAAGITLSKAGTLYYFAHDPATDLRSEVKTLSVTGEGDTTGIESVAVDAAAGEVEYFNLQGIRVNNPANGVFIRRVGNTATKVVIK